MTKAAAIFMIGLSLLHASSAYYVPRSCENVKAFYDSQCTESTTGSVVYIDSQFNQTEVFDMCSAVYPCIGSLADCTTNRAACTAQLNSLTSQSNACTSALASATATRATCNTGLATCTSNLQTCSANLGSALATAQSQLATCQASSTSNTATLATKTAALTTCNSEKTTLQASRDALLADRALILTCVDELTAAQQYFYTCQNAVYDETKTCYNCRQDMFSMISSACRALLEIVGDEEFRK